MIYLTQTRLMRESERTVRECAQRGDEIPARVCRQLLTDAPRYTAWHAQHERRMHGVSQRSRRDDQLLELRSISLQQIHRTALVGYMRDRGITGARRDELLRESYGALDVREAAVAEHRNFIEATSTALCVSELLTLAEDTEGIALLKRYEETFAGYFGMFCDRSQALSKKRGFVDTLLPDARLEADELRKRILAGEALPRQAFRDKTAYLKRAALLRKRMVGDAGIEPATPAV